MMYDERNPPPADSPAVYGSIGHMNGAMDPPLRTSLRVNTCGPNGNPE